MRRSSALAAVAVALLLVGSCSDDDDGEASPTPSDGVELDDETDDLSATSLPELGGDGEIAFADYAGRPVVVNFFASTCAPCVEEMPAFEEVNQAAAGRVAFVGVAVNDRVEDALALVEDTGVTWDLAADPDGSFIRAVGGVNMPTTAIVDAEGRIVDVQGGKLDDGELVDLLAEHAGIEVEVT